MGWEATVINGDASRATRRSNCLTFCFDSAQWSVLPKYMSPDFDSSFSRRLAHVQFDYVFLSASASCAIQEPPVWRKHISEETLVIAEGILLADSSLAEILGHEQCACLHSEIDCRKLAQNEYILLGSKSRKFDFALGNSRTSGTKHKNAFPRGARSKKALVLEADYRALKIGKFQLCTSLFINTQIVKKSISLICIDSLALLFEEREFSSLQGGNCAQLMLGLYHDLLRLSSLMQEKAAIKLSKVELGFDEWLKAIVQKEAAALNMRKQLTSNVLNAPPFLADMRLLYEFSQKEPLEVVTCIRSILKIADGLSFTAPYLKSLDIYLTQYIGIRDNSSEIAVSLNQRPGNTAERAVAKFINYELFNYIKPRDNMMNYPPFQPLPRPSTPKFSSRPQVVLLVSNPVVMMTSLKFDAQTSEEQHHITQDSPIENLQELITGTEEMTYPDEFYDCASQSVATISKHTQPVMEARGEVSEMVVAMGAGSVQSITPNGSFHPPQSDLDPLQSGQPPQIESERFGTLPPSASQPLLKAKRKGYHRRPIPITKNSTTKQLYESHTRLMEAVQFNSFMEKSTSSRYGALDTTVAIMNSASNSSKGSKSSTPSASDTSNIELSQKGK
jgi:hypothetical protein